MVISFQELIKTAKKTKTPIIDVVKNWYMLETGYSPEKMEENTRVLLDHMFTAYEVRRKDNSDSLTGWVGQNGALLRKHRPILINEGLMFGIEVAISMAEHNAGMGTVVACPTAGACGVVPGVILSLNKYNNVGLEKLTDSLIVAGAVGEFIKRRASISGAVSGCQAEIGTATAMGATAIVTAMDPENLDGIFSAPALALKALMGLVCDPVGGFVEIPCVKRNGFGVSVAFTAAEMALAGVKSAIPFDEVTEAMGRVGRRLPEELRETGKGGVAATETARKMVRQFNELDSNDKNG